MNSIQNWDDVFMTSAAGAIAVFMAAIPKIIAFVLIIVIGWFLASLIGKLIATLLKAIKFNELHSALDLSTSLDKWVCKLTLQNFLPTSANGL